MITIDLLDDAWAVDPTSFGPIVSTLTAEVQERLDEIPTFSVSFPVSDTLALQKLILNQRVRIHFDADYSFDGIIKTRTVAGTSEPTIVISGPHRLYDTTRRNTWLNWRINNQPLPTALGDLLEDTGWFSAVVGTHPDVSGLYSGLSRWAAVLNICERFHLHVRLDWANPLYVTVGVFGDDSGIVLAGPTPSTPELFANEDVVPLESLTIKEDSWETYNRILALGAGDGDGQLTLEQAAPWVASGRIRVRSQFGRGASALATGVVVGTNIIDVSDVTNFEIGDKLFIGDSNALFLGDSGDPGYSPWEINYIIDISSNTLYLGHGVKFNYDALDTAVFAAPQFIVNTIPPPDDEDARETVMSWKEIVPADVTDDGLKWASINLYYAARSELERRAEPLREYSTSGLRFPAEFNIGDKVRLMYVGAVYKDGAVYDYINENRLVWVMGLTRRWSGSGETSVQLDIATIDATQRDDVQSAVEAFMTGQTWMTTTQTVAMRYNESQSRWVEFDFPADFYLEFDDAIHTLESCILNLRTDYYAGYIPVGSGSSNALSLTGTGSVLSAGGASEIQVRFRTSPPGSSGYPANVHVWVNGTDYSSILGGPWAGGTVMLAENLDLTEILNRQSGGFKRQHHVQVTCESSSGEVFVTFKIQAHVRATRELHA